MTQTMLALRTSIFMSAVRGFGSRALIQELGTEVVLCTALEGETGMVIHSILDAETLTVRSVETVGAGGAYRTTAGLDLEPILERCVSDEDLHRDGQLRDRRIQSLVKVLQRLGPNGQRAVICTRAERPAVTSFNDRVVEVFGPIVQPLDTTGAVNESAKTASLVREYFHPRKAILAWQPREHAAVGKR